MAAGDSYKVMSGSLHIRSGPGPSYESVGKLSRNEVVEEIEQENRYLHHSTGWSDMTYLAKISSSTKVNTTTENSNEPTAEENTELDDEGSGYQPPVEDILTINTSSIDSSEFVKIRNIAGVFGLPYQFLPSADLRLDNSQNAHNIGSEYGERIIKNMPLLFIAPGKANFMTKYSKKNKESILEKLISLGVGNEGSSIEDLLDSDGRYYTFEYDQTSYYKFVNPMCRIAAQYLGLQDVTLDGTTPLDSINWEDYTKSRIKSIGDFGSYSSIPFYMDTATSISESYGNDTTQSMIASTVNSISDYGRELTFLLGYGATATGLESVLADADVAKNLENVQNIITKALGSGNFLSSLAGHLATVATGGKLIFPEIWSDSTFSRNYSCDFKFISPDPSNLSIYLNVLVPLFHLIALVAPQSVITNPNGYTNPFLIRAVYKGFFNVDMGIITSMSVTKGAECQWTPDGLPTSINVSIDIKDLYQAMSITSTENTQFKYDTLNNTALMDYIANLCGINIYKPEAARMIEMWYMNNFKNRARDFFKVDIWNGIGQNIQNLIINNIYR